MQFKSERFVSQFHNLPSILQEIAHEFDFMSKAFGVEAIVTRITDPVEGESGVHPAGRAIDFRDEFNGKRLYKSEQIILMTDYFNTKYARSDGINTILWHSFAGNPYHFHIQVPVSKKTFVHKDKFSSLKA